MSKRTPAEIGMSLIEVDTPALIIDLDAFESNLEQMAGNARRLGMRLRPHAKMHKSSDIARAQIARGAVGVCCQKVSEAEALIDDGISNVLITNQVVGKKKLDLFVELSKRAEISICVDNAQNVTDLNEHAVTWGEKVGVLVEVNVGGDRCGVSPGESTLELAKQIEEAPNLNFLGLHAYQGRVQHIRPFQDRKEAIEVVSGYLTETVRLLNDYGITCEHVTGAGTGTWQFEGASNVFTELQAGSYAFMDADYARNEDVDGEIGGEFQHSLFLYATVMSVPNSEFVVVDAGLKALAFDAGMPLLADDLDVKYHKFSNRLLDITDQFLTYS